MLVQLFVVRQFHFDIKMMDLRIYLIIRLCIVLLVVLIWWWLPNQDILYSEIVKVFDIGERLSKKIIKSRIADVYKTVNIKATAKAVDINNWFEVRDTMLTNDMGKREAGFEILALKNIN